MFYLTGLAASFWLAGSREGLACREGLGGWGIRWEPSFTKTKYLEEIWQDIREQRTHILTVQLHRKSILTLVFDEAWPLYHASVETLSSGASCARVHYWHNVKLILDNWFLFNMRLSDRTFEKSTDYSQVAQALWALSTWQCVTPLLQEFVWENKGEK